MQNYSNLWSSYLEFYQRSLQDFSRLWFPALPDMMGRQSKTGEAGKEANLSPSFPALPAVSPENWMALFMPWMPKVEANIEPMMEEAARVSMRIFMPWNSDPLWVEALVGKQDKTKAVAVTPSGAKTLPKAKPPVDLEVNNAIKRSRMQD